MILLIKRPLYLNWAPYGKGPMRKRWPATPWAKGGPTSWDKEGAHNPR
jgi:hypothetical protein